MINQAPIVRYTASVSENFFPNFWRKTFSSLNGMALSSELQPRFCLFQMIFRKKDLRISLITHDLDLT
jgi:hypothetical protein